MRLDSGDDGGGGRGTPTDDSQAQAVASDSRSDSDLPLRLQIEKPSTFLCKLDKKPFRACRSPFTTPKLKFGSHTFKVKASHEGTLDPTPAIWQFKVASDAASGR